MYIVEKKPVAHPFTRWNANPINAQMRKLAVGESFLVSLDDPNWTGKQVKNENMQKDRNYAVRKEGNSIRIGRVK